MLTRKIIPVILSTLAILTLLSTPAAAAIGDTTLVSANTSSGVGSASSNNGAITPDGRYVVFQSSATNLVATDANGYMDIFRRDRQSGTTVLVSLDSSNTQGDGYSEKPAISSNGQVVAFASTATNLGDMPDSEGFEDIFVRDIANSTSRAVSVDTSREGFGDGHSYRPTISQDGSRVAYESNATNLISDDTNSVTDVFVDDGSSNLRVSISSGGDEGDGMSSYASISGNGRYVAFASNATNLVANDTNARTDIFVRDMNLESTTRVSISSTGVQGDAGSNYPVISADGRYVAFVSAATNLVTGDTNTQTDVFVRDTQTNTTTRVSVASNGTQANSWSDYPFISPDGRYVGFPSFASNLVTGDSNGTWDVFLHDLTTGLTARISVGSAGVEGNGMSIGGSLSTNAAYAAFTSYATNMVSGLSDTNGAADVFVREPDITPPTVIFGVGSVPGAVNGVVTSPPATLMVRFSEDVIHDFGSQSANTRANYLLIKPGLNGIFDTSATSIGVCDSDHITALDDVRVGIDSVTYDNDTYTATINFESGEIPLALGLYRLYVCGAASIDDLSGNPLNAGSNTSIPFRIGPSGAGGGTGSGGSATTAYPATGFAPGRVTNLPAQTVNYAGVDDMQLNIPSLGVQMPVVEVPKDNGTWDVSWLGEKAGWLGGSAFPTWEGNSVITGHVYDANGQPGPFVDLVKLKWGDRAVIHAWGQEYTYEVRSVEENVNPKDTSLLTKHEELPWLTLVTCHGYNEAKDTYLWRTVVRAVQVDVK